jgi:hypothetical protein
MISVKEISQLKQIPFEFYNSIQSELKNVSIPWIEAYSDYQSGGWYVAQLMNSSGSIDQQRIDAGNPVATPLLQHFPTINQFIEETLLDVRIARLARISPGSWMHEHNDEVGIGEKRLRLHIPIITNPDSVLCFDGYHVYLKPGFLWKLDHERVPHAAANYGNADRIHLIFDCRVNLELQSLMNEEIIDPHSIRALPILDESESQYLINQARSLINKGLRHEGEAILLETFCKYDLQGKSCYDLLLTTYNGMSGFEDSITRWRDRLKEVRGR